MGGDAINYVEQWVMENVNFSGYPSTQIPDPEAVLLAEQCVRDASQDGFTLQDLQIVVGNLPIYIHRCMIIRADQQAGDKTTDASRALQVPHVNCPVSSTST